VEFKTHFVIVCNRNTEEYKNIIFFPEVGEINAHAQTVYTRPSPRSPNFRRSGYKANSYWCFLGITV